MIKLNSSRTLQALLAGSIATAQPVATVGYNDKSTSGFDGDSQLADLNGTSPVDICDAPAAGAIRHIDYLTIRNYDSAQVVVTVRVNQGGTTYDLIDATLEVGEMLGFTHSAGWYVNTADGSRKSGAVQDLSGYQLRSEKDASGGYPGMSDWAITLHNALGTIASLLTNAATAIRTYTFPDKSITIAGTDDVDQALQDAKDYADGLVTGLLDLKGDTDCSGNPNYPAALKGDAYYVTVAGKIGGASGTAVDVGDVYVAKADNAGGTQAAVGSSWFVLERNLTLSNVTNDAQTKAAIVPNTAPSAGQIAVGNAGGTAYAPVAVSGDVSLTSAGVAQVNALAADVAGTDHLLTRVMLKDVGATYLDKGNSGTTTQTLDYTAGSHQKVTCTGNFTLAVSNLPPTGNLGAILLEAVNFGANTVTWPTASFVKPDGSYTSSVSTWLAAWTGRTAFQSSGTDWIKIWSRDASTLIIAWAA